MQLVLPKLEPTAVVGRCSGLFAKLWGNVAAAPGPFKGYQKRGGLLAENTSLQLKPVRAPTRFDIWIDCYDSEYLTVITVNFTVITVKLTVCPN